MATVASPVEVRSESQRVLSAVVESVLLIVIARLSPVTLEWVIVNPATVKPVPVIMAVAAGRCSAPVPAVFIARCGIRTLP